MKKFIIVLMVVAVASFLFVGCLPGTTTPETPTEPTEPTEPTVTATVAPIITAIAGISITSSATQYINATEAAVVTVTGTAPTYSEVKVYVGDVCAGTADVGVTGTFTVVIAEADLGDDALDKVIYATAKEAALDVSAHSVEYAFVLDQVAPGIDSVAATADKALELPDSAVLSGSNPLASFANTTTATRVPGKWTVHCLRDSATPANVVITSPTAVATTYSVITGTSVVLIDAIPGIRLNFTPNFNVGDYISVTVKTTTGPAIQDRYTIKFNEDVSFTGAAAGVYDILLNGAAVAAAGDPATYKEGNDTGYWNTEAAVSVGDTITFTVYGVTDLAGNAGGTAASPLMKTCYAGAASATALAP